MLTLSQPEAEPLIILVAVPTSAASTAPSIVRMIPWNDGLAAAAAAAAAATAAETIVCGIFFAAALTE
jgi:hypothetical protein